MREIEREGEGMGEREKERGDMGRGNTTKLAESAGSLGRKVESVSILRKTGPDSAS